MSKTQTKTAPQAQNIATVPQAQATPILSVSLPCSVNAADLLMKPDSKSLYVTISGTIPLANGGTARYTGNVFIPASNFSPETKVAAVTRWKAKQDDAAADASTKPAARGVLA